MISEIDNRELEDSMPVIPRGSKIDPLNPPKPDGPALASWVRTVRGGILAGSFYIERNLNIAIEAYLLGLRRSDDDLSILFHDEILAPMTFERRVNTVVRICELVLPDEKSALKRNLAEFRTIRNTMAHNSCWFEGVVNEENNVVSFIVRIRKGKGIIQLDKTTVEKWNGLTKDLITATGRLADKIIDPQSF